MASRTRRREESKTLIQRPAPYQKRAASWMEGIHQSLVKAGTGRAVRLAVEVLAARQARGARALDFTAAQLADAGGCSARSVNRAVPELLEAGVLILVEHACHGRRLAAIYRLGEALPSFRRTASQRTKCPSPPKGSQASPFDPLPPMQAPLAPRGQDAGLRPKVKPEPETGPEALVAQELRKAGADEGGVRAVVKGIQTQNLVPKDEACRDALKDIRAAMDYLALSPGWVERPIAFVVQAAKSRSFGERVKLWLKRARRDQRRKAGQRKPRPERGAGRRDQAPPWLHLLAGPEYPDHASAQAYHAETRAAVAARLRDLEERLSGAGRAAVAREVTDGLQAVASPGIEDRMRESLWAHAVARVAWMEALPGTQEARC